MRNKIRSLIYFFFIILAFFTSNIFFAQEIKWENLSLGPNLSYLIFTEDLGNNWQNSPAIGGSATYKIHANLYAIGEGYISKINSCEKSFPDIIYLGILGGIKHSTNITENISVIFSSGIQSNTFEFEDEAENKLEDNTSESEFGIFIGTGISSNLLYKIPIDINFRYQSIFSKPVTIKIISISISVFVL